jgi:hypothetical protein
VGVAHWERAVKGSAMWLLNRPLSVMPWMIAITLPIIVPTWGV